MDKTKRELEQEHENNLELFATEGWKQIIENATELEQALIHAAPDNALTNDQWQFCRGQISQLRALIGFEEYVKVVQEYNNANPV